MRRYEQVNSRRVGHELPTTHLREQPHLLDTPPIARIIFRVQTNGPIAQLVEQLTLNQRVAGSSPARLTIQFND